MKKIILVCSAGMSTSLLMNKMRDYAQRIDYAIEVKAHPVSEIGEIGQTADVILLGPQIRFNLANVQKQFPDKPVESIPPTDYGMMNGENVVKLAQKLLGDI
ncbi:MULTISPECIES: PTS sugar transporter subunit IIB [Streptococcus]|uniref:PTS sugar transporter subunit IIB n=1 Tax=Streptococcus caledonicus TaxID=2614158 RepID=A0ABW0UID6_9STRE|nr:PTS sugar transporter subunit IIB [Streptococcus sp. S784/96/1]